MKTTIKTDYFSNLKNFPISNRFDVMSPGTSVKYFGEIKTGDSTVSIDNICCRYFFPTDIIMQDVKNFLGMPGNNLLKKHYTIKKNYIETSFYMKELYTITLSNAETISLSFYTQWIQHKYNYYCDVDFNPNKCFGIILNLPQQNDSNEMAMYYQADLTKYIIDILVHNATHIKILRFDVAVDIPINISLVSVIKDNRKHNRCTPSAAQPDNYTDYLGTKHKSGYFKAYNKTRESNLSYDLTRLEMTSSYHDNYDDFIKQWPEVYARGNGLNITNYYAELNKTEQIILMLLNESPNRDIRFQSLSRKIKAKLRPYIYGSDGTIPITVSEEVYYHLMRKLYWMIGLHSGTENNLLLKNSRNL